MSLLSTLGRWLIALDAQLANPAPKIVPIVPAKGAVMVVTIPAAAHDAVAAVVAQHITTTKLPRGIRNNNPGNIRYGAAIWQGTVPGPHQDPSFVTFTTMAYGVRAAAILFYHTYYNHYGLNTVRKLINRWAPPVENDTGAYVAAVAKGCGVSPDDIIDLSSKTMLLRLLSAVFIHENGGSYVTAEALTDGTNLALG